MSRCASSILLNSPGILRISEENRGVVVAPNASGIENSWKNVLQAELKKPYMAALRNFLSEEYKQGKTVFPKKNEYFQAFNCTPFPEVRVVILGQDPYHGPGQAHGLCFSVRPDIPAPPSLKNIYKELKTDMGLEPADHGYLKSWADQGVLLLNSVLTVEAGLAASHKKKGWETFTDAVIGELNEREEPMVFILWGAYAQKKGAMVDRNRHCVLESVHPSPLSAHRGFFGCRHFSKANDFLIANGYPPIDWELPDRDALEV